MKKVKSFCDKLLLKSKILSISYVVRFVINNKWTIAWKAWTWLEVYRTLVRRKTRLPTRRCRVWAFFFFFFFLGFTPTRLQFVPICAELGWFDQNQAVSAISGRIGQRLKWPKQAKIGPEYRQKSQNSHLRGILMCFLPSSFFVLWIKA